MLKDIFGPVRAKELEEELGEFIENLKILGYKEVKPWGEFVSAMKSPSHWDAKTIEQRISTNLLYYRSNYLAICCGIVLFRILFSPFILFSLLLVLAFNSYFLIVTKGALQFGEIIIDRQKKIQGCMVLSILFLALIGTLSALFWSLFLCLFICFSHMLFRARSISSKMNKAQEEVKLNMHSSVNNGNPSSSSSTVDNPSVVDSIMSSFSSLTKNTKQATPSKTSPSPDLDVENPTVDDTVDVFVNPTTPNTSNPSDKNIGSARKRPSPTSLFNRPTAKND